MDAAREEAQRFLAGSPFSQRLIKDLVYRGLERDLGDHMRNHVEALKACFRSEDHKEGVASFLEKRQPRFTGN
jgi:enoyl-CoA hydratase